MPHWSREMGKISGRLPQTIVLTNNLSPRRSGGFRSRLNWTMVQFISGMKTYLWMVWTSAPFYRNSGRLSSGLENKSKAAKQDEPWSWHARHKSGVSYWCFLYPIFITHAKEFQFLCVLILNYFNSFYNLHPAGPHWTITGQCKVPHGLG